MSETLKQTALHAAHKALGAKMVPFGGWDMPVWYTSVKEEHAAARATGGLFDVTHMGVTDVRGPGALAYIDRLGTNDASKLKVGRSHYSYMLDEAGNVIDDIMVYRIEDARYLIVINASNNDKDIAWMRSQLAGFDCTLRDLRDATSGADQRVDLALQGPASLPTLCSLLEPAKAAALTALPYTGIMRATLRSHLSAPENVTWDVFISRTGYTGERVAYEIFVHPAESVALWNELLDAGKAHGVKPCGLAARDSLRTEAGLPLYGHELAGPLNLAPYHIGFDNFVKLETEFVGKVAYQKNMAAAATRMVRYRMNEKGVRVSKPGDPLLDRRGRVVGHVTSCAADSDGYLCGLAMVESALASEGTALNILALPEKPPAPLTAFAPMGARTTLPDGATVISRFPPRKS